MVDTRRCVDGLQVIHVAVTIRVSISISNVFRRSRNNVRMGEHDPDSVKGDGEEMVCEEDRRWSDAKRKD